MTASERCPARRHPSDRLTLNRSACLVGLAVAAVACSKPDGSAAIPSARAAAATSASPEQRPATRVEVAVIQPSEARVELELPGEVVGSQDAVLAAPSGGFVEQVLVKEGQQVDEGQVLARVNSSMYQVQVSQVQARLRQAERDLERATKLADLTPEAEREAVGTQVELLQAQLRQARLELGRSVVTAPFAGTVATVMVERGEVAPPASPVVRLVKLQPVHVVLSVPDRDVVALTVETQVTISVPASSGVRKGIIRRISPASDLETRSFRVEVEHENADGRLLPGMIASVKVEHTLDKGAFVLPQGWLVTRRSDIGVFVDEGGAARWLAIEAGRVVRDQVVVPKGISAGQRVIITGQRGLEDGDPLIVAREGRCCEHGRAVF